jgi:hypothetical protein
VQNKTRGAVEIDFGDGQVFKLRFTFGALAKIEEHFGKPFQQIFASKEAEKQIANMDARDWIVIFWAGLQGGGHKEVTKDQVAELIDIGNLGYLVGKLTSAMSIATAGTNPPKIKSAGEVVDSPLAVTSPITTS